MQCLQEIWQTVGDTRRTSPNASIEVLEKKSAQAITAILTRYRKEIEPLAAGRTVRYHSQRVQEIGIQPPGTFDIWLKYRLDEPGGRGEVITTNGAIAQGIGSRQFQVLLALANAPRRMLTIDEILDRLWKNRDGTGARRSGHVMDIVADLDCLRESRKINEPSSLVYSRQSVAGGMTMELTASVKTMLIETARSLKGSARRLFMARTVNELGQGGQQRAARELGWGRMTIRKGLRELDSGLACLDAYSLRGRKRAEVHLPNLLTDIKAIVDGQSQADPQFRTQRLYTRLTATEVRRQLIAHKGYTDAALPTAETIGAKLNALGYYPQKVAKSLPKKSAPN
jgi:hypothetical protein